MCGCHRFDEDGKLLTEGVKRTAPTNGLSKGVGSERYKQNYEEAVAKDVTMHEFDCLAKELERKNSWCEELEVKRRRIEIVERTIFRYSRLYDLGTEGKNALNKRIFTDTKFSCINHFEAFLDFLCDGRREVLANLKYFRKEYVVFDEHGVPVDYRPQTRGKTGHASASKVCFLFLFICLMKLLRCVFIYFLVGEVK